ncbi:MAG TPA: hypothetical protein VF100_08155 [Thermoanaerobaculia bacterium]
MTGAPRPSARRPGSALRTHLGAARRRLGRLLRPEAPTVVVEVPLALLRCQVTPFGERQGFAGRPIDRFPPAGFFATRLVDPSRAEADFAAWYRLWFVERQGWRVAKRRGGMRGGSLDRTVRRLFSERTGRPPASIDEVDAATIEQAIGLRVAYYFALLDSLRQRGQDAGSALPCTRGGELYVLRDGHHRAAALRALGAERVTIRVPEAR